jgi:hypothetical protein
MKTSNTKILPAAEVRELFDSLATQLYYGMNFRMTLAEIGKSDLEALRRIIRKADESIRKAAKL